MLLPVVNFTIFLRFVRCNAIISGVNGPAAELALLVVGELRSRGFLAWLVGGCVRDLLLGISPKDYDVSTNARPDEVLAIWPDSRKVGAHFGVVLVHRHGIHVEVATFRSESAYVDGRRPSEVRFESDPRKDVLRRDFTVNALMMDPVSGEVLDYVGGQKDLQAKLLRAIGDPGDRFGEDHLRMLRAIRFAARLGFEIHPDTEAAIKRLHASVEEVSAERIRDEIVRILTEGSARRGFELLLRTGLLHSILPEVEAMLGVEQPPEFHPEGDVWMHTLIMLEGLPAGATSTLAMGVLLHDVGKPPTFRIAERIRFDGHVEAGLRIAHEILTRLRFPNEDIAQVEALVGNHMRFMDAPRMKESTLKRFLRLDRFDEHLALHRLDCGSSHGHLDNYEYVIAKREEFGQEQIRPARLVNGLDLMEAGFEAGPELGRVLAALEDA
ncbi:MAG: CCA tRNA nucleotidyltransferase, partial [Bryobacteraceae bacterium]|nr:CCA tRNA nucleotidyltransferase [Bryobacteraceae bacterium]